MLCEGCVEWGPPPDTILSMPPPPLPGFESPPWAFNDTAPPATTHCGASLLCEIVSGSGLSEYSDLPRRGPSLTDDTWLLVLVSCCIGVLLLGTVLALFFMKFREAYSSHCPHGSTVAGTKQTTIPVKARPISTETRAPNRPLSENRALWAAMTPRGTKHFISVDYPQIFVADSQPEIKDVTQPDEPKYETVVTGDLDGKPKGLYCAGKQASFDNSGFVDFGAEYEEPQFYGMYPDQGYQKNPYQTNTYRSNGYLYHGNGYQENEYRQHDYQQGNYYQDGYYQGSQRYQQEENETYAEPVFIGAPGRASLPRPLVSSPTRIEHPNLPPLNRYPRQSPTPSYTMRRSSTAKRHMETGSLGRKH